MQRKHRRNLAWLSFGAVSLFAALAAAGFVAVRLDSGPPFTPALPALPVVPTMGTLSHWSPDSRQLLVNGDRLYAVRFPEQTATVLPEPPAGERRCHGFDYQGRPLVSIGVASARWLYRLAADGAWKAIAGPAVYFSLSPDGRHVAMAEQRFVPQIPGSQAPADTLTMLRLPYLTPEARLSTPGQQVWSPGWVGPNTYAAMKGNPSTARGWLAYRPGQGRFTAGKGAVPRPWPAGGGITVVRPSIRSRLLRALSQQGIPVFAPALDAWLAVPPQGPDGDVPLGPWTPSFIPTVPSESPDGRWVAVIAPDGTLGVLDLGKTRAGQR
jgi:hypothetical protein